MSIANSALYLYNFKKKLYIFCAKGRKEVFITGGYSCNPTTAK